MAIRFNLLGLFFVPKRGSFLLASYLVQPELS
jgi:hypothetical protein